MLQQFVKLPIRKRVGILGIFLGFLAIFAGSPYDKTTTRINLKEFALSSVSDESIIYPEELADWIIQGKYDYRLIDLRGAEQYSTYNIPGAENVPVIEIIDADFLRNEKLVFYADDDNVASQAWFLIKADNYKNVYQLKGGMDGWKDNVLFPLLMADATPEQIKAFEKKKEVSKYFGGQPRSGGSNETINKETPKLKSPPKINVTKKKKKKSREGC